MRVVSFVWILVIVVLSLVPIRVKDLLHTRGHWHFAFHFAAFFASAVLFCWSSRGRRNRATLSSGLFLLALTVEWLEVVLYHARFEWEDVAMDAAGVIAGWLVAEAWRNGREKMTGQISRQGE